MSLRLEGLLFALLALVPFVQGLTPSNYLNDADKSRLKALFASVQPYSELSNAHYSILGLTLLGSAVPNSQDACNFLKSKVSLKNLDSIYHATAASKLLGNCQIPITGIIEAINLSLKEDAMVQDIFYGVLALKALGKPVDSPKMSKLLLAALKKDDSILNLGYAFHVASQLQGDTTLFVERIEDAVVQADEVDGLYLQFEGGLSITATILGGVFRLAEVSKKPPTMTREQTVKFTNYLLSRKFVQGVKGASQLLDVLQILTKNKFHIPVCVTLASKIALSTSNPVVQVRVTNVLGAPLAPSLTLTADTCTRLEDGSTIFSKKTFTPVTGDTSLYSLNFLESKPLRGFYKLLVSVSGAKTDLKLVGNTGAEIQVKVMTEVGVESVELGIVDRDQSTTAKTSKVEFGKKLAVVGEADYHQKVLLRFMLRDKLGGGILQAHQAFVQLSHSTSKQEIVFVAEPDAQGLYKFDLDLNSKAKEFNYQSGKYSLSLIIGDAVIANPFTWHLGDLALTFPQNPTPTKEKEDPYAAKPVIQHLFREQEKQPTQVVSQAFSALVLVPMLLLIILVSKILHLVSNDRWMLANMVGILHYIGKWAKIGVNISNFPLSLNAIGFHVGLAGILGLLGLFWFQLNMFTTLKYLSGLTLFTFLAGHSLLSHMAKKGSS